MSIKEDESDKFEEFSSNPTKVVALAKKICDGDNEDKTIIPPKTSSHVYMRGVSKLPSNW